VKEIEQQYVSGLVTSGERYNKVVDIWGKAGDDVSKVMMDQLKVQKTTDRTATKSIRNRSTRFT
jgi:DNA-directed RNA polymerase subunit beta'